VGQGEPALLGAVEHAALEPAEVHEVGALPRFGSGLVDDLWLDPLLGMRKAFGATSSILNKSECVAV
jgi:hypothetical protein